ncbi:DNA-binding transcriptional regulator, MarR family [Roseivivax halotolerans]|uniref:DNA-binding transcriptional regulator, MarR family n=1 Tax=Roseivivax halotolerans TaxID=93684 RepID=A0A1I5ZY32_9RHOB|nr:MarR family transcriptional regulator [Roseivivax halotolerans]SFQ61300.1 DNA-binding transcriptional regulator, MarR family [Roseivivax halotolerans]
MTKDVDDLHHAVATLMRALKIAETKLRIAHNEFSFTPAEIQTLRFVSGKDGCKLSELGEYLGIVPTTASSLVDRLVERGLLRRDRPDTNRRAVALHLTVDGRDTFGRLEAEERATMQIMLDALDPEERADFVRKMTRIADHVSRRRDL